MPATNNTKTDVLPIRITPAMRRQVDDLIALGFGTQTDIIRIAVDRMHRDETCKTDERKLLINILE